MDLVSFDPRLTTENNFHDDNRPYRYEQNIQEQQNLFTNNDNNNEENDNNNEDYIPEIKMKIEMKILYSIQMKTIQVTIPLQNLQLLHKMHHKVKYQQTLSLLEFQLELLA